MSVLLLAVSHVCDHSASLSVGTVVRPSSPKTNKPPSSSTVGSSDQPGVVGGGGQLHGSVTHDKCLRSDLFSVKNH